MKMRIRCNDGSDIVILGVNNYEVVSDETPKYEVASTPTEGKIFMIYPMQIDRSLFCEENIPKLQGDFEQFSKNGIYCEDVKRIMLCYIREAFEKVDNGAEKYSKPFATLVPPKVWNIPLEARWLDKNAIYFGGRTADWVEQSLEWAQRIYNGEKWEDLCTTMDSLKWFRYVKGKYDRLLVGGSCHSNECCDSGVGGSNCEKKEKFSLNPNFLCKPPAYVRNYFINAYTVPLVRIEVEDK